MYSLKSVTYIKAFFLLLPSWCICSSCTPVSQGGQKGRGTGNAVSLPFSFMLCAWGCAVLGHVGRAGLCPAQTAISYLQGSLCLLHCVFVLCLWGVFEADHNHPRFYPWHAHKTWQLCETDELKWVSNRPLSSACSLVGTLVGMLPSGIFRMGW